MTKLNNKLKKVFSALTAVCIIVSANIGAAAMEVDYETISIAGGFIRVNRYTGVLQGSTENITGDLVIPSEAAGVQIMSIADSAFYGREGLTSVTIPSSVKSIGDQAFTSCLSLKSVTIEDGVTSMGKDVFRYCYSLTDVDLPDTLTAIEDYAFQKCIALESIKIPDGVQKIGSYAFADSTKLQSVSLPNSVETIGDYCFNNCTALASVNLPSAMSTVPTAMLSGCSSLEKVVVPEGVESISGLAFRGCSSLRTISLPDSVTAIRASAFDGCSNVTFYVNAGSYSQAFAAANKIPFELGTLSDDDPSSGDDNLGSYPSTPFTDDKNHWARKYIEWAYAKGYFAGTSASTFSPNARVNRGMMVALLYRMDGSPDAGTSKFTDVSPKAYYASAVAWAEENGIVSGVSATQFKPADNITLEQMASMLYRYAKYKGMDTSVGGDLSKFKDTAQISNFAGIAMTWAVGTGIIVGSNQAMLNPKGLATRAQAAVMLQKFENLAR